MGLFPLKSYQLLRTITFYNQDFFIRRISLNHWCSLFLIFVISFIYSFFFLSFSFFFFSFLSPFFSSSFLRFFFLSFSLSFPFPFAFRLSTEDDKGTFEETDNGTVHSNPLGTFSEFCYLLFCLSVLKPNLRRTKVTNTTEWRTQ